MEQKTREIMDGIRGLSFFFRKRKNPDFCGTGARDITLSQLDLMAYLYEHKRVKMSDLAKHTGVKMPSMTDTISRLSEMNMVKREHDEEDRRTVWVSITKEMEKTVRKHIEKKDEEMSELMDVLTESEKTAVIGIIAKLKNKLERMQ
jgi:DNA-binding MarR family transcriptional regulator